MRGINPGPHFIYTTVQAGQKICSDLTQIPQMHVELFAHTEFSVVLSHRAVWPLGSKRYVTRHRDREHPVDSHYAVLTLDIAVLPLQRHLSPLTPS